MSTVWDAVVGQPSAVASLTAAGAAPVHAYLFVGPSGSTKHEAARAFASIVINGSADPDTRDARLALAGEHPDIREVERVGPAISKPQADEIVHWSAMAPVESDSKVLILHDFHLVQPEAAAALLKSIEEPPASTTFIVLADFVAPDLVTIASRCVRIDFRSIADDVLAAQLRAEGIDPTAADEAVAAASGDITRARILARDPSVADRRQAFASLPSRLNGTGTTVMGAVDDLLARIEHAAAPLAERHAAEVAELEARAEQFGERGSGRKALEERHRRELRRHRVDELRHGLGVLAGAYRDILVAGTARHPASIADAVTRIHRSVEALEHNPNEPLLLQSLLWSLPTT